MRSWFTFTFTGARARESQKAGCNRILFNGLLTVCLATAPSKVDLFLCNVSICVVCSSQRSWIFSAAYKEDRSTLLTVTNKMMSGSIAFTDFEEGIAFDADDPDFAVPAKTLVPSVRLCSLQARVPSPMSLASVHHPAEMHGHDHHSQSIGSSFEELQSFFSTSEAVLSIEELRLQLNSCFTCGVSWHEDHVSLDCRECGGYSLERPCPLCDGQCAAVWKRDLTMSHASGRARWEGSCMLRSQAEPQRILKSITAEEESHLCSRLEKLAASS